MNSFSSASQIWEPFPRRMNGGSPPTEPNARTGEFTPPGIMLSARCCKRRDCSTLRDVVDGIEAPTPQGFQPTHCAQPTTIPERPRNEGHRINQIFIERPSSCNIAPVTSGHQLPF